MRSGDGTATESQCPAVSAALAAHRTLTIELRSSNAVAYPFIACGRLLSRSGPSKYHGMTASGPFRQERRYRSTSPARNRPTANHRGPEHSERLRRCRCDVGVIDLMIGFPAPTPSKPRSTSLPGDPARPREHEDFEFPAQYMFKDVPNSRTCDDPVAVLLEQMDRYGIEHGMLGSVRRRTLASPAGRCRSTPTASSASCEVDPNRGHGRGARPAARGRRARREGRDRCSPPGSTRRSPINDKKFYPIYAKCIELDIPICVCAGVPGPRVPIRAAVRRLIDEVCWYFPELKFVTRHGCEPWADLAVKLLLKWPNLYYSTTRVRAEVLPEGRSSTSRTRAAPTR